MPDRPRRIPEATVARLPLYYRALVEMAEQKIATVSSERLAEMAGVNAAKVRKDFSYLGSYGTRGVGYDVEYLLFQISRELGLTQDWPVVIVGVGNLGHALANYRGFSARGFRIVGLVDADPAKQAKQVGGLVVEPLEDLPRIVAERDVAIGIIATPASAAQEVAELLVSAGVSSILNFAPTVIAVPAGVSLRKVDLSIELQILSFYQQRRDGAAAPGYGVSPEKAGYGVSPEKAGYGVSPEKAGYGVSPEKAGYGVSPEKAGYRISSEDGRRRASPGDAALAGSGEDVDRIALGGMP